MYGMGSWSDILYLIDAAEKMGVQWYSPSDIYRLTEGFMILISENYYIAFTLNLLFPSIHRVIHEMFTLLNPAKKFMSYKSVTHHIRTKRHNAYHVHYNSYSASLPVLNKLVCLWSHYSTSFEIMQDRWITIALSSINESGFLVYIKPHRKKSHSLMSELWDGLTCPQSWQPTMMTNHSRPKGFMKKNQGPHQLCVCPDSTAWNTG